jgi:hypothetical protein
MNGPKNTVTCPACGSDFNCGPGKIWNLVKQHIPSQTCAERKARRGKQKADGLRTTLLTSFFAKATDKSAQLVPSKVSPPTKVKPSTPSTFTPTTSSSTPPLIPKTAAIDRSIPPFMVEFIALVAGLPSTVPEGEDRDVFAVFSGDPSAQVPRECPMKQLGRR